MPELSNAIYTVIRLIPSEAIVHSPKRQRCMFPLWMLSEAKSRLVGIARRLLDWESTVKQLIRLSPGFAGSLLQIETSDVHPRGGLRDQSQNARFRELTTPRFARSERRDRLKFQQSTRRFKKARQECVVSTCRPGWEYR